LRCVSATCAPAQEAGRALFDSSAAKRLVLKPVTAPAVQSARMPATRLGSGARHRATLSPRAYRKITLAALLAVCFIVVTGAAVRLTGSGLGCPEWPSCEPGKLVEVRPTDYHAMVESVNRLVTGFVSVMVILAALGAAIRRPLRRDLLWLALALVAGIVGQIVLGGLVVFFGLLPPFVMGHFLMSMLIILAGFVLYERAGRPDTPDGAMVRRDASPDVAPVVLARVMFAVAFAVVFTGTIVTATGPHAGDVNAERFTFALADVTRVHSGFVILLAVLTAVQIRVLHVRAAPAAAKRAAWWVLGVLLAQAAVGYTQYFTGVPALLVGVHIAGAVAVWIAVIRLVLVLPRPVPPRAGSSDGVAPRRLRDPQPV
jgi:cytochrome c oxidase assembly protein subunit 15